MDKDLMPVTIDQEERADLEGPSSARDDALTRIKKLVAVWRHEMSNKICAIHGACYCIRREIANNGIQLTDTAEDSLRIIEKSVESIYGLMEQMKRQPTSYPPQIQNPKENAAFEPVNFSEVLTAEVNLWKTLEGNKVNFTENIDPGLVIYGDLIKLQEIFTNLLKNAIEMIADQPAGRRNIKVMASVINGAVQLMVEDSGPGIPPEQQKKLFKLGFSTKNGTGIGLYQSRKLAHNMGGDLWLIDNSEREDLKAGKTMGNGLNKGATAILELPLSHVIG